MWVYFQVILLCIFCGLAHNGWVQCVGNFSITLIGTGLTSAADRLHQASPQARHAIYRSTILPKLDYCCAVWDPHYSTDKTALNRVQRFASRVITHKWHANHSSLLNSLNWQPLEIRSRLIKLKVCYNILNNYSCIPSSVFTPHPYSGLRHFHDRMLLRPKYQDLLTQILFFYWYCTYFGILYPLM